MTSRLSILFLFIAVIVGGCKEVETVDGHIPHKYLPEVEKFVGTYEGKMGNRSGQIILTLDGDMPKVEFQDGSSNDFYASGCNSQFGNLRQVRTTASSPRQLRSFTFAFDPNDCRFLVRGREVEFEVSEAIQGNDRVLILTPYLYTFDDPIRRCEFEGPGNREVCRDGTQRRYMKGQFTRVLPRDE